nr:unnamed protein product [Digitaria exilis]
MEIGGGEDDIAISEYMAHLSEDDGKSVEDDTYENTDFDEIDDTSDIDLIPEHEVENKVVDSGGYIFDGDVGDDDLYSLRMRESTIQSKGKDDGMNRDEGKGKPQPDPIPMKNWYGFVRNTWLEHNLFTCGGTGMVGRLVGSLAAIHRAARRCLALSLRA